MTGAVLEAAACAGGVCRVETEWPEVMRTVAEAGRSAYQGLMHDDPDLIPYFRAATPIDVIERMLIGSRPSARREQKSIRDLQHSTRKGVPGLAMFMLKKIGSILWAASPAIAMRRELLIG